MSSIQRLLHTPSPSPFLIWRYIHNLLCTSYFIQSAIPLTPAQWFIPDLHFLCSKGTVGSVIYWHTSRSLKSAMFLTLYLASLPVLGSNFYSLRLWKCKSETGHYLPTTACGLETGHTVDCASWSWLQYWEIANCKWDWCGQIGAWQASLPLSLLLYSAYSLDQGMPGKQYFSYLPHFFPNITVLIFVKINSPVQMESGLNRNLLLSKNFCNPMDT